MNFSKANGLVSIADYRQVMDSNRSSPMKTFSDQFISQHRDILSSFVKRWVHDPLQQWSRQWEYPFSYSTLQAFHAEIDRPLDVLDAGSGITFFPFFLARDECIRQITCCDSDETLTDAFEAMSNLGHRKVRFLHKGLSDTGLSDRSLDVVSCISVLEHTDTFESVAREFHRILRPSGILVVTFDISLDGLGEISLDRLPLLIAALKKYFDPDPAGSFESLLTPERLQGTDIVTTPYIAGHHRELLPWKHPTLHLIRCALRTGILPRQWGKCLTFSCHKLRPRPESAR